MFLRNVFFRISDSIKTRWYTAFRMPYNLSLFGSCGKNVILEKRSTICGTRNIHVGNDVYIGPNALIYSTNADLHIGSKVVIGPNVSIINGDHRTDVVGKYMVDISEKLPQNDLDIHIFDDVWIGANVSIFKGVHIGEGSVIAGGSVVVKDVPQYSIYIAPGKIKPRFSEEQITLHKSLIIRKQQR